MSRLRPSLVLLAICVGAVLISALRLATERTPLPTGSSYSMQPDGAMGLYDWAETIGARTRHLRDLGLDADISGLLVLQPETPLDSLTLEAFDGIATRGGTLIVAGDSVAWLVYVRSLGVTVQPAAYATSTATTPDGMSLPFSGHYRLVSPGAESLLVVENGDSVGLRLPYKEGTLIVVASSDLLTNTGLRDDRVARFVFREILSKLLGQSLAFDEIHHSFAPATPGPATVNTLLFDTAPGRAVIYGALLTFLYVLLSGRRLGPPLSGADPTTTQRTMYEHVQMLADLYRRAGQFRVLHDHFTRHYARLHSARLESARTESELVAAVAEVNDPS
jgi:hypothetical protein